MNAVKLRQKNDYNFGQNYLFLQMADIFTVKNVNYLLHNNFQKFLMTPKCLKVH